MLELFATRQTEAFRVGMTDTFTRREKAVDALKKEWGGNFAVNEELARRALTTFGGVELAQEIAAAGFADHPLMIRIWSNIGKLIGEGQLVPGTHRPSPEGAPSTSDREAQQQAGYRKRYKSMT
jgi:hypothetical protein